MKVIKIIRVLVAVIPFVRKIIEQVEIPGFGPEKRQAVLDALRGIIRELPWEISEDVVDSSLGILGALIDITVAVLNLLGHDWAEQKV